MPKRKPLKVIIDTNLFISYLIGKKLIGLKKLLIESQIVLAFADQNLREIKIVSCREKFRKYFKKDDVEDLIDFLWIIGEVYEIEDDKRICRDPKDDFLLSLSEESKADYLITRDKDLLDIRKYLNTEIVTIDEFEKILQKAQNADSA